MNEELNVQATYSAINLQDAWKQKAKYIQSLGQKKHRDEGSCLSPKAIRLVAELLAGFPTGFSELYAVQNGGRKSAERAELPLGRGC